MSHIKVLLVGRAEPIELSAEEFVLEEKRYVLRRSKQVVGDFPEKTVVGIWQADDEIDPKFTQSIVVHAQTPSSSGQASKPGMRTQRQRK